MIILILIYFKKSVFLQKKTKMQFQNTLSFAQQLDQEDELASWRNEFIFPQHQGKNVIYFTGNSLGLQPKLTQKYVQDVMDDWANMAVEGHFFAEKSLRVNCFKSLDNRINKRTTSRFSLAVVSNAFFCTTQLAL